MSTIITGNAVQQGLMSIMEGKDLTQIEARNVMGHIMSGEATAAQIGGLLTALRLKGETVDEITGFAEAMRESCSRVHTEQNNLLDTCGTGDQGSANSIFQRLPPSSPPLYPYGLRSTGTVLQAEEQGVRMYSEALGVNIHLNQEQARDCLDAINICFLFAQVYHPSMKYAAAPRKELGVRTIFNLLGPLTNPAGADRQVLGVYDVTRTEAIAESLGRLGLKRALVVASYDGLDEISISDRTKISELKDGAVQTYDIHPDDLGLKVYPLQQVLGGTATENADIIKRVLSGEQGGYRDIVLANAGASIYVAGLAGSIAEGVHLAKNAIDSGKASDKLTQLIQKTGEYEYVS